MDSTVVALLAAFASLSAALIGSNAQAIGRAAGVLDVPDGIRKLHGGRVPLVGGLAMVPALAATAVFAALLPGGGSLAGLMLCVVVAGLAALGLADDRKHISPWLRLGFIFAMFMVFLAIAPGVRVTGLLLGPLTVELGVALVAILGAVAATGVVFSVNMTDGVNGLCIGLNVVWLTAVGLTGDPSLAGMCMILALAAMTVFAFNMSTRLFLGDCGAYLLGGASAGLMLIAVGQGYLSHLQVAAAFVIPILDTLYLMVLRARSRRSLFSPDREHLHHVLMRRLNPVPAVAGYVGVVAAATALAFSGNLGAAIAIVAQIVMFAAVRIGCARPVMPAAVRAPSAGEHEELETPRSSL